MGRHLDLGCGLRPRNPYKHQEVWGLDISDVSYYRLSRQRIEEFKFGSAQFSACFQVCLFKNSFEVDLSRSHVTK